MSDWTPITLFVCCMLFSAACSVGSSMVFKRGESITWYDVIGRLLFHGPVGGGLGMAAYEYFALQNTPWTALAISILYGSGIIPLSEIKKRVPGVLRILTSTDTNDK